MSLDPSTDVCPRCGVDQTGKTSPDSNRGRRDRDGGQSASASTDRRESNRDRSGRRGDRRNDDSRANERGGRQGGRTGRTDGRSADQGRDGRRSDDHGQPRGDTRRRRESDANRRDDRREARDRRERSTDRGRPHDDERRAHGSDGRRRDDEPEPPRHDTDPEPRHRDRDRRDEPARRDDRRDQRTDSPPASSGRPETDNRRPREEPVDDGTTGSGTTTRTEPVDHEERSPPREQASGTEQRRHDGEPPRKATGGGGGAQVRAATEDVDRPAGHEPNTRGTDSLGTDMKYPMNEEGWWKTIAIGTVLEYLSIFLLPALLLLGYYVRVIRQRLAGDPEPPSFSDPGELLVDGLKGTIIAGMYSVIPIVAFVVFVLGSITAILNGNFQQGLGSLLTGVLIWLGLTALFSYAGFAGLARFADTGSMLSGFSPKLAKVLVSGTWFIAWLKVWVVTSIAGTISVVIAIIPVVQLITVVLTPLKIKYVMTVTFKIFADAYADIYQAPGDIGT
ncbi:DUF4013 domain-containing protein [Haloarchaeobius salinus]|uniref:DUF4013 domain-containing protein n=1 Tax=Haloarchaeobius salinus TaxID=1198298 RepID=UPI0034A1086B